MSAIDDKYAALGGAGGFLGAATIPESSTPDGIGRYRHFQGGSIYWTPQAGAHEVHGFIRGKWESLGWERSFLGYPITDETPAPDAIGRFNHFQGGSVYWTPQTGAHEVHGAIRDKWESLGWERSSLGYPITDETPTPSNIGRFNDFQHGSIYWTAQTGAYDQIAKIPQLHRSSEGNAIGTECWVDIDVAGFGVGRENVGRIFPAWVPVESHAPVILEGEVVSRHGAYPGPDVSFEDFPLNHYTHDFCFDVVPDATADSAYTNLLAIQVRADGSETRQDVIEVEWETGLAASNDDNPLQDPNTRGESGGFFSTGHLRRDVIWNWPTTGDRVHVEGLWIWDRGHPPANTEIHPPRLIAIQRRLPTMSSRPVDPRGIEPGSPVLATRVDIFARGDGGALWNNRRGVPGYVQPVLMSSKDYFFRISNPLPRPSPQARLRWSIQRHNGDTFPTDPDMTRPLVATPIGGPPSPDLDYVNVTIPWKSRGISDTAVFARTIYLYWDEGFGVPPEFRPRVFRVTLDKVFVHKSHDPVGDGEYRLFIEVAGNWMFVNEIPGADNILDEALGDTGDDEEFGIHREFIVYVPPDGSFRVHAGGWEADGVNDLFGKLIDPNHLCDNALKDWLQNNLFTSGVFLSGSKDDPIGEINSMFNAENGFGVGGHQDRSVGPLFSDVWSQQDTDPNDSFRLFYRIDELPWSS